MSVGDAPLPDGNYEVFVVDTGEAEDGTVNSLEVTVLAGTHKGQVVVVVGRRTESFADLLGTPGTLTITAGAPKLQLEP